MVKKAHAKRIQRKIREALKVLEGLGFPLGKLKFGLLHPRHISSISTANGSSAHMGIELLPWPLAHLLLGSRVDQFSSKTFSITQ